MFHETNAIYIGMSRENWIRQMSFIFAIILRPVHQLQIWLRYLCLLGSSINLTRTIPPTSMRKISAKATITIFRFLFPETPRTTICQYLSLLFELDPDIVLHVIKL